MKDLKLIKNLEVKLEAKTLVLTVKKRCTVEIISAKFLAKKIKVIVQAGAKLNLLISRTQLKPENWKFVLQEQSQLAQVIYLKNQSALQFSQQFSLVGRQASQQTLLAGQFKAGQTKIDLAVKQLARQTSSQIIIKALAESNGQTQITVDNLITKVATESLANITQQSLILSPQAQVIIRPNLVINNNEVLASHAATLGDLDNQALIYLQERGLTYMQAKELLVQSFFRPLLHQLNSATIKSAFCKLIS
ncbi:MAG: SufD family Fe-S cluster assembly protein [Candidatus Buchananbacteria bacterium]